MQGRSPLAVVPATADHAGEMDSERDPTGLPPGHQPYDPLNGIRIGAIAGGLVGIGVAALTGFGGIGTVVVAAAIGGSAGYAYQRRERGR